MTHDYKRNGVTTLFKLRVARHAFLNIRHVIFSDKWRRIFSATWREWAVLAALHDAFSE
jgi:hypothetical protein